MSESANGPLFFTGDDPLSIASDLLNTVDVLAAPSDRLTEVEHLREFLEGHDRPRADVSVSELEQVRRFREQLRAVWQAGDVETAAERLNALLARHRPTPHLVPTGGRVHVRYGDTASPLPAFMQEILQAMVSELAEHGLGRLGTCAGDPCRCVFLDRSRNRKRRYCCELCTSRAAAAAYRRRQRVARAAADRA